MIWALAFYWIVAGLACYFHNERFEAVPWFTFTIGGFVVPAKLLEKAMR